MNTMIDLHCVVSGTKTNEARALDVISQIDKYKATNARFDVLQID
jgi:hypothetical protein